MYADLFSLFSFFLSPSLSLSLSLFSSSCTVCGVADVCLCRACRRSFYPSSSGDSARRPILFIYASFMLNIFPLGERDGSKNSSNPSLTSDRFVASRFAQRSDAFSYLVSVVAADAAAVAAWMMGCRDKRPFFLSTILARNFACFPPCFLFFFRFVVVLGLARRPISARDHRTNSSTSRLSRILRN